MASAKKPDIPADKLGLYEKLIATVPEIERKGAANPYTSLNGHMFCCWGQKGEWLSGCRKASAKNS